MIRFALCLCLALAMVVGLVAPAFATQGTVNGVLVEERVISLPNDQNKWYVSVVGDAKDARYQELIGWFDSNTNLKHLKDQVHFCPVRSGTAIYEARYASNIQGLPTVRVQDHEGVVVYEAAGLSIPMTPDALHTAIATDAWTAQGCRPILPWRREMEKRCPGPGPCPPPDTNPDPEPQPLPPAPPGPPDIVKPAQSVLPPWWAMLLAMLAGAGVGTAVKWRETYAKQ